MTTGRINQIITNRFLPSPNTVLTAAVWSKLYRSSNFNLVPSLTSICPLIKHKRVRGNNDTTIAWLEELLKFSLWVKFLSKNIEELRKSWHNVVILLHVGRLGFRNTSLYIHKYNAMVYHEPYWANKKNSIYYSRHKKRTVFERYTIICILNYVNNGLLQFFTFLTFATTLCLQTTRVPVH